MTHHLMIVNKRYIAAIAKGKKTVECRLSKTRKPPFGCVDRGDTLWIKISGGPVVAAARVRRIRYFQPVTPAVLRVIWNQYRSSIAAGSRFYRRYREAGYATIILIGRVTPLDPFWIDKRDRRAWVVLPGAPLAVTKALRHGSKRYVSAV